MVAYPARLAAEGENRVMLTMPDIPELVLVAEAEDEALARAPALLYAILDAYRAGDRPLPRASRISGAPLVVARRDCMAMAD
jgi:predicted RNase H-like HicB family nuclease